MILCMLTSPVEFIHTHVHMYLSIIVRWHQRDTSKQIYKPMLQVKYLST